MKQPAVSGLPLDDAVPPPPPAPDLLKTLADGANAAANREVTNWFFFLTFAILLAIAVGSTTHRRLFLEEAVKLPPVLGVDLPLIGFYWVAPALFVILHFYVLVQLQVLAEKVGAFLDAAESEARGDPAALRLHCQRLDAFMVTQVLAAARLGQRARALRTTAWITLVIGPVVLLLFFQLRFLPYHSETTAWVHRGLILTDLLLLWWFWPPQAGPAARRQVWKVIVALFFVALALLFAFLVATVPDEGAEEAAAWIDRRLPWKFEVPAVEPLSPVEDHVEQLGDRAVRGLLGPLAATRTALFDGTVTRETRRPASLFARRLVVPDEDFVALDGAQLVEAQRTVSLHGRDLRFAVLDRTDLRKADFSHVNLGGASLQAARLQDASFADAQLQGTNFGQARLQGVNFRNARLWGAYFRNARLWGADFRGAPLLNRTELQGADFASAELQGADFSYAQLWGADFFGARLQGTNFNGAHLHGASIISANMQGSNLQSAHLWRVQLKDMPPEALDQADARGANATWPPLGADWPPQAERKDLVIDWLAAIPDFQARSTARERLRAFAEPGDEDRYAAERSPLLPQRSPDPELWAKLLGDLGCASQGAPCVARGIIMSRTWVRFRPKVSALARRLLDTASCPGAKDLDPDSRAELDLMLGYPADPASPPREVEVRSAPAHVPPLVIPGAGPPPSPPRGRDRR